MNEQEAPVKATWLERWGTAWATSAERWMPDPFIFAILLVFVIFIMGIIIQGLNPYELAQCMYKGFWKFLAFAMQMVIILITGYAIAYHPAVHGGIVRMCSWPKNGKQAALLVATCTAVLYWVNWGLGLIFGALFAREMGRQAYFRKMPLHYPMIIASAYGLPILLWHWGLSGSAPLLMTVAGHPFEKIFGIVTVDKTIFSGYAIGNSVLILVFAAVVSYLLHPKPDRCRAIDQYTPEAVKEEVEEEKPASRTFADKIENNWLIAIVMVAIMACSAVWWFATKGFMGGLNLNSINFVFIFIGLLLYHNPIAYAKVIYRSAAAVGGIVLQFPFYAGIQGVMMYSGLGVTVAGWLSKAATPFIWPVVCWFLAGVVNVFIPSGGGEWLTIGQSIGQASVNLGVPIGKTIIAFGAGDAWTNLVNPFWAIPILAITGVRVRDFFGYPLMFCILAIIPFVLGLLFIPY
jgi:short-chain fatty acids transporter